MKKATNTQPKPQLPIFHFIGGILSLLGFLMVVAPFGAMLLLLFGGKGPMSFQLENGMLMVVIIFSGITLLHPSLSLFNLAISPAAFFSDRRWKSFYPITIGWWLWIIFVLPFMMEEFIYSSPKRGIVNPPEFAQKLAESYSEHFWILATTICVSILCQVIVIYSRKFIVLPKQG
jgi:hypothetical protein